MAASNTTEFRQTGESHALAALLEYHGLSSSDVLERLYQKLENLGHTSIYEITFLSTTNNRMINVTFKTTKGLTGIQIYGESTPGVYRFSLVDFTTYSTELLFTMADKQRALGGEPAD